MNPGVCRVLLLCGLLWAAVSPAAPARVAELEDGPARVGFVETERWREQCRQAQEQFRLRVPLPFTLAAESPIAAPGQAALVPDQPGSLNTVEEKAGGGELLIFPAMLLVAWFVALRRVIRPTASAPAGIRPRASSPAAELPARERVREEKLRRLVSLFQVRLTATDSPEPSGRCLPAFVAAGESSSVLAESRWGYSSRRRAQPLA